MSVFQIFFFATLALFGTFAQENPPVTNDPLCPEDGIYYYPHETDCSRFYECINGDKYEFECPPDLLFNPETNLCDYPENVNCENSGTHPPASSTKSTDGTMETSKSTESLETSSASEMPPVTNDPLCPEEGTHFYPHESDCSRFYECVDGNKYEFQCPPDLLFNPDTELCDYPENVNCDNSGTNSPSSSTESTSESGGSTDGGTTTESSGAPVCSDGDTSFHPDPTDCAKFYECVNGEAVSFTCPDGLLYNPETFACDYPENVDCEH